MNSTTLHQINVLKQQRQEGRFSMQGLAFTSLLHNLIREYGKYHPDHISVDVEHFSLYDKRLVLSHIESAEWYEHACESITNTETLFDECKKSLQRTVDDESDEVFRDDMEEMRRFK